MILAKQIKFFVILRPNLTLLWVLEETPNTSDPVTHQNHIVTREWRSEDEDKWDKMAILKGKTKLVLKSLLLINKSILHAESLQG